MSENFPAWMGLNATTRAALIDELDRALPEHDPRAHSNGAEVLFTNLGRRSVVGDLRRWLVKPEQKSEVPNGYERI